MREQQSLLCLLRLDSLRLQEEESLSVRRSICCFSTMSHSIIRYTIRTGSNQASHRKEQESEEAFEVSLWHECGSYMDAWRIGRKRWSLEEKRRIVELTVVPGGSVVRTAQAEGVNANQVFL